MTVSSESVRREELPDSVKYYNRHKFRQRIGTKVNDLPCALRPGLGDTGAINSIEIVDCLNLALTYQFPGVYLCLQE